MNKTIILNQDSLIKIKESMVGTDNVSHAVVCVNEARPEIDEFELGQESDNPPVGGNYVHVEEKINEGYCFSKLKNIDLCDVGKIECECYFDMFELAKEHFGVTNDIRECGYILPDGTMLDFSGRHTLNKGTDSSHLAGRRGIDHRNVYEIGWSEDGNTKYFDFAMEDFIKLGAIRIHASKTYALINLYKKPTSQQIPLLIRLIQYAKGCVDVEIGDGNESLSYGEFDNAKPNAVIAKINRFFDEKISLDESIVDWAVDNLPQYRKQIMAGKNGYIPMRTVYDQETNKIKREPYPLYKNESIKKYLTLLKEESLLGEEFNADGNTTSNPYKKRWDAERKALKDFVCMYGKLMQSKEDDKNGKLYKCFWDKTLSNLIGYNYCLAVQYDEINNKPKSTIYVRACDRFTPNIRRNLQYDARGHDNQMGTYDDIKNYGIV